MAEEDSGGEEYISSKPFPCYTFPYGISPHHIQIVRRAENDREHPPAPRGAQLCVPGPGLAYLASGRVQFPGSWAEEDCLNWAPTAFPTYFKLTHKAEYIPGSSEVS